MHTAIQDLKLEHLWVVYPGHQEYPLDEKISVVPLFNAIEYLKVLADRGSGVVGGSGVGSS
jgi:hypothetical protein